MQINLNKQLKFVKFSIRAYVAEISRIDPKKCWPFGSLVPPENIDVFASYQPPKSTFWSTQNCPININGSNDTQEHIIESIEINNDMENVIHNGSSKSTYSNVNNDLYRHKNSVAKGPKIGDSTVADDNGQPNGKQPQKSRQKYRLLSDIYNDPASEYRPRCDVINPVNFNSRFVIESEDESKDDVTLTELVRKQKGVIKGTDSTLKRKKIQIEEPRVDQDKKSKHDSVVGPKVHSRKRTRIGDADTHIITNPKTDFELPYHQKNNRTEDRETENEDSEMEAVMLLARRFNKVNCVKKKTATKSSLVYADTHKSVTKENSENLVCSLNRNPADFSIPNAENEFMRAV